MSRLMPRTHVPDDASLGASCAPGDTARYLLAHSAASYKVAACSLASTVQCATRHGLTMQDIAEATNLTVEHVSAVLVDYEAALESYGPGAYSARPYIPVGDELGKKMIADLTFPIGRGPDAVDVSTPSEGGARP